jgi:hypothetical protein
VTSGAQEALGGLKIGLCRELHVAGLPFEDMDGRAGPLHHRRIVREARDAGRDGALVGVEK